jgi:membrane protein implicated in regulation of membrane protease activity
MPDPIETLLLLTLLALAAAIAFLLLGPEVILLAVVAVSLVGVVGYRRWRRVRERGNCSVT